MSLIDTNDYRQNVATSTLVGGALWGGSHAVRGNAVSAVVIFGVALAVFGVITWWVRRPTVSPTHREAISMAGPDDLIVYWRPGCIYCDRLERALRSLEETVIKVDVRKDSEAAEFVASLRGGDVVVPTVVTRTAGMVAPEARAIRSRTRSSQPA